MFVVPSSVVDKGLKLASESQIKVLLYVLRHCGEKLTDELVSSALGIHSDDIKDAIEYWCDKGLLIMAGDELVMPENIRTDNLSDENESELSDPFVPDTKPVEKARPVSRPQKPEQSYVRQRIAGDSDVATLINEASNILGKLLSQPDMATLVMLHDTDGLPVDVILMLITHCVEIGKGNMRYIEKTGISWAHEGIVTFNLAEEKIRSYSEFTSAWNTVAAVFGIKLSGSPTQKQLEFANRWVNVWRFSEDMLRLAYERCVDAKGEMKVSYINGKLKRWNDMSLKRTEDVLKADAANAGKKRTNSAKASGTSPSYDIDAYERKSIFDD